MARDDHVLKTCSDLVHDNHFSICNFSVLDITMSMMQQHLIKIILKKQIGIFMYLTPAFWSDLHYILYLISLFIKYAIKA